MNILLLAYASEPGAGSEYGVGWMVPTTMAKHYPEHEIYVLTRSRCKEKISESLKVLGYNNLHFLFYDIPKWLTYPNEMKSNWGEQINYLQWQIYVMRFLRKQHKAIKFDVIHHLTFNQYRTPSPGYWMDIPFVVGPVGGAECIAPAFWQDLDEHTRSKEEIRLKGKDLKVFRWFNTRKHNEKIILCSSHENLVRLTPYKGKSTIMEMPAIAFDKKDFSSIASDKNEVKRPFEMIYAGKAWDWKGLRIFLAAAQRTFASYECPDFRIKLIGIRFEDEQKRVMGWVNELGLKDNVELIPFIQRSELLKMMTECDLSVYPAFRDSGSMSVLEACALGCPSICFDAGGQDIFPDDILIKVPVGDTYDDGLKAFATKLKWAYENRQQAKEIGIRSKLWVEENLTWEKKVHQFVELYMSMVK